MGIIVNLGLQKNKASLLREALISIKTKIDKRCIIYNDGRLRTYTNVI